MEPCARVTEETVIGVFGICKDGTEIPLPDGKIKRKLAVIKLALQGIHLDDVVVRTHLTISYE